MASSRQRPFSWVFTRRGVIVLLCVAPLPIWLPIVLLALIGTQGAHTEEEATHALVVVAAITAALVCLALFGVWQFVRMGRRQSRSR